jgi:hypothetical protein
MARRLNPKVVPTPKWLSRAHFVKAKVRVHQYCDGTHAIFHGRGAWLATAQLVN